MCQMSTTAATTNIVILRDQPWWAEQWESR